MNCNKKQSYFSMIELLIVVAILFTLISLLSPALQSTIRTANLMACASNLRSLGVIFENFADDNESEYLHTESLFEKRGDGTYLHNTPMMRRSFRGWPSDLRNYGYDKVNEIVYCPEDTSSAALEFGDSSNDNVSYEIKSALIDLSRSHYKRSVRNYEFQISDRQSLLISRGTFHSIKTRGHHSNENMEYLHNIYYVDGHVALDYAGYNHPNVRGTRVSWTSYPVLKNNTRARGNDDYLERRCELSESAF